ncbi:hypothetical protein [Amycolatopsis australiensis]|uniref:Uncharacterized protein n=1 Tax=Amycolatopsis australiensis TaxID=546364 RepID=A0A1K1SM42_9PSEU|nr:hypothetical protein [Amycolatopsis australiensis]SFW85488.1 hypothetical protein SAMN04489730_6150 [Amycolatopsis australiensis]
MDEYLAIYLRDQLALGVTWRELARRARDHNRGTELGTVLAGLADAIAEDVRSYERIMGRLRVRPNPLKVAAAVAAERAGRLKLNGRLRGYSPLSRFWELEALAMGIDGKRTLWTTLADLAGLRTRLPDIDFDRLLARAAEQRATVEPYRRAAGQAAFGVPAE